MDPNSVQFFLLFFSILSFEAKLLVCILNKEFNKAFFPHLSLQKQVTLKFFKNEKSLKKISRHSSFVFPNIIDILLEAPVKVIIHLIKKREDFRLNFFTSNKIVNGDIRSVFLKRTELFDCILKQLKGENRWNFNKCFWKVGGVFIPCTIHKYKQFFYCLVKGIKINLAKYKDDRIFDVLKFMTERGKDLLWTFKDKYRFINEELDLVTKYVAYFENGEDLKKYHHSEKAAHRWMIKRGNYFCNKYDVTKHFCQHKNKKLLLDYIYSNPEINKNIECIFVTCHRRRILDIADVIIPKDFHYSIMFEKAWSTSRETFEYIIENIPSFYFYDQIQYVFQSCIYTGPIERNSLFEFLIKRDDITQNSRDRLLNVVSQIIEANGIENENNDITRSIIIDIITLGQGCPEHTIIFRSKIFKPILKNCNEEQRTRFITHCSQFPKKEILFQILS